MVKFRSLSGSSKLKEVFTTFMISQLSKSSSTKGLEQVFHKLDKNKDGVISGNELLEALKEELSSEVADAESKRILSLMDSDGSGYIDYTEFLRVSIEEKYLLSKENLKKTFAYLDKDRSGTIEKAELMSWLNTGGNFPEEVLNQLLAEVDSNEDGSIDISELEELLIKKFEIN